MPSRTTEDYVKQILAPGHDYDTIEGPSLIPFMNAAYNRVTWIINNASNYARTPLSSTSAVEVESWLAAALYKQSDQQLKSSVAGKSSGQFRGADGKLSEANMYFQTACMLDESMMLAPALDGRFAAASWLGKTVDQQIDYDDRSSTVANT